MTVERTRRWMIRASDPGGFEKLLADAAQIVGSSCIRCNKPPNRGE